MKPGDLVTHSAPWMRTLTLLPGHAGISNPVVSYMAEGAMAIVVAICPAADGHEVLLLTRRSLGWANASRALQVVGAQ